MIERKRTTWILAALLIVVGPVLAADADKAPTVAEQVAGLQAMCNNSEQARTQRQADNPLYNRLGGYDRIHDLTRDIVKRHDINPQIKRTLEHVDNDALAKHVADFIASGTGGPQTYTGRSMPASHAHLNLTDADFLAAGGDVMTSMQYKGYGQNEIDEVVCILVSLKDQVVFK